MASRKPGLGPAAQGVWDRLEQGKKDGGSTGRIDPTTGARLPPTNLYAGINEVIPSGDDFGVYWVQPVDQYYMGPTKSSCVVAHVFIPVSTRDEASQNEMSVTNSKGSQTFEENVDEGLSVLSKQFSKIRKTDRTNLGNANIIFGYAYVMFRNRAGATSGVYKYGPMTLDVYRSYREYSSKGKGIKQILEPFGYSKSNWPV